MPRALVSRDPDGTSEGRTMKVLVSAASRHGATADIARTIGETLTEEGLEAVVLPPDAVTTLDGYAGAVLGSGIYVGHWMDAAKNLVERHSAALASLPVWLFSSGPIGEPPTPEEDPADIAEIIEATHAREHRVFAGKVDKAVLGLGEKVILKAVRVPEGDFRPWADVREWTRGIAAALRADSASPGA
jgi:menaquinone-dependent protoporphyrinogen oxidase